MTAKAEYLRSYRARPAAIALRKIREGSLAWRMKRSALRKARALARDRRGVFAIEVALLAPGIVFALGGALDVGQMMEQRSSTQYAAYASASAGARMLPDTTKARAAATDAFATNKQVFLADADASMVVTVDVQITAAVDVVTPALFPILITSIHTTATATD